MQLWHFRRVVYGRQNEFGLNQGGKQMFRKGTFKFNQDANFNFQLNRVVMWGGWEMGRFFVRSHPLWEGRLKSHKSSKE